MLSSAMDLLLPPRCGGCRRLGSWLCVDCRARVRHLEEPLCRRCGVPVESARASCGCRDALRSLARLRSATLYEGPIEMAVHRLKYQGWRRLARPLAQIMAERLMVEGLAAEAIVAVPLHPARMRQRGFNQAELLAQHLRAAMRVADAPGGLVRTRATPPQVGHDRRWRMANVSGAFEWKGPPMSGRPILVVDDVATTGATLDACARALRAAGSGPVMGVSVARVTV